MPGTTYNTGIPYMKLLLENWRKHLKEEEASTGKIWEEWGEWTINELNDLIDDARKAEKQLDYDIPNKLKAFLQLSGVEMAKHVVDKAGREAGILGIGPGITVTGFFIDKARSINKKRIAGDANSLEDFPILDILDIDPLLVKYIEDDKLNVIDEEYQEYLGGLDGSTRLKDIMNINKFLQVQIALETDRSLMILLRK
jgi:hypothetical protein